MSRRLPGEHALVPAVFVMLAVTASRAAHAYQPLPWDMPADSGRALPEGEEAEERTVLPPRRTRGRRSPQRAGGRGLPVNSRELFGTAAVFFDPSVTFDGHVEGISAGRGYTLGIPATLPGWLVYALFIDPLAVFSTLTAEAWTSGFRGGLRTSPVFDEIDFELLYSLSSHDDELEPGGELDYTRVGLGVRLSGPAPSDRLVRASLALGWTWHDLDFDRRQDLSAAGPYVGLGIETRFSKDSGRGASDSMIGARLSARWDFVRGTDRAGGDFDATVFTGGAGVSFYW